ncbi:MAG: restriction endonuclease subunit S [bacterium]|jgi:type I restriction enzyme S subunit|nr:restriction endonuclease subunit S [bacterium]
MGREHWVETSFTDILDIQGGTQPPKKDFIYEPHEGYIQLLQIRDFGKKEFPTFVKNSNNLKKCEKEDILIGRYGASVGKILTGKDGAYNVAIAKVVIPQNVDKRYVYFYLNSYLFQQPIKSIERSAQDGFNKDDLQKISFCLPPLNEQKRIVEKLDTILPKVKNAKARLENVPKILKKFRQSVLADACSGKLTEEWREGKELDKPIINNLKKSKILDDMSADYEKHEIPENWTWCIIDDVSEVKGGKRLPAGALFSKTITDFPYIMAGSLKNGTVMIEKLSYIEKETQNKIKNYIVKGGDVYITIVGACIGDSGIIPNTFDGANLTENALKITNFKDVYNRFLAFWLRSRQAQDLIKSTILSCAQGKLALGRVKAFPVPLPPIEEQHEIVRRVEKLFAIANSLEEKYKTAIARVEKIEQSVLAKAFRGELVDPDPNDEPAENLLKRILEEKSKMGTGKKNKGENMVSPLRKTTENKSK